MQKINANLNNITNAEFYCANLHNANTQDLLNSLEKPDCIIIDPPRAGVHKNLLVHIKSINPKRLVYVIVATQRHKLEIVLSFLPTIK